MAITIVGSNNRYLVSAVTSGGSKEMFFKINTVGENAFLDTIIDTLDRL
ncbi:MAG: DUF6054 family protein [Bacilli bacterium]|nr:DUF6054 family protein [Bacilli bacterium]